MEIVELFYLELRPVLPTTPICPPKPSIQKRDPFSAEVSENVFSDHWNDGQITRTEFVARSILQPKFVS